MSDAAAAITPGATEEAGHDGHGGDSHDHAHAHLSYLAHHFDTPAQQFDAAKIGMWAFLVQELLFFSGIFVSYGIFRSWYPETFSAASHQLDRIMGCGNTIVLLFSSLTAALAVRSAQLGTKKTTSNLILITIACAFIFLVVKFFEYRHKFEGGLLPGQYFHPDLHHLVHGAPALPANSHVFYSIYFMATGIHGLHVIIGIGVLLWIWRRNERGDFTPEYYAGVDLTALYWHLVDLVWIYLFPLLYLID
jgi:cytochrome c oxidase subunit III